jgi:hypothetical protein
MSNYDAQQMKLRLREAETAHKLKSKEIHLPNFRTCSDPLSIDIEALIPSEEPEEDNIFETGASKFGMSYKRYRHALAKSVANDRDQPASPPKIGLDRPVSRHNNFEARMARLLVRSPQTRSNITSKITITENVEEHSQNGYASAGFNPSVQILAKAGEDKNTALTFQTPDKTDAQGRVQSWSERHEEQHDQGSSHASNVRLKDGYQSITVAHKQPLRGADVTTNADLPNVGNQQPHTLPPLVPELQSRPKSAVRAPLLSVGAALERKLAGDSVEPESQQLSEDITSGHDVFGSTSVFGNQTAAASVLPSASSFPREAPLGNHTTSSFSFQKSFQESENVESLMPSVPVAQSFDETPALTNAYKLTSADILAATSVVDLTNLQCAVIADSKLMNVVEAEPPKLSYEANAFVSNLKFSISDEARFLQELGSSRTKVIAARRKKIEELVSHRMFHLCESI